MKNVRIFLSLFCLLLGFFSCKKEGFITSPNAFLTTSVDTLRFDTVFTSVGSVTHSFKIFNQNDQKLKLSEVRLMGGVDSKFKLNVDGLPGTTFQNLEIAPFDSLYVFVSVTIDPTRSGFPFVVQDSILVNYNGNDHFVQLEALGQNANFLRNRTISTNTTFNNNLPYVILGGLQVDSGVTLTINKGCKIYSHADAPIIINGTLKVNGEKNEDTRVTFRGDRIDPDYRDFPGSWPGIYFNPSSKDNVLNFVTIKNAYQGVITQLPSLTGTAKVTLNECIIDNIYDAGILSINSSINARNCLITNCGNNIGIAGGSYNFYNCTVASYSTAFMAHKNPVLYITNASGQAQPYSISANFSNCIFWGEGGSVDDEIVIDKKGTTPFSAYFNNNIYKGKTDQLPASNLRNQSPQFDSIDVGRRFFSFQLKSTSPAIDKAIINPLFPVVTDIEGRLRGTKPDIGCYEYQ